MPHEESSSEVVSAEQAACRVVCLSILLQRADVEQAIADGEADESVIDGSRELREWLLGNRLVQSVSRTERRLIGAEIGTWIEEERVDFSWRREALAVILWGLGILETLRPWDEVNRRLGELVPEPSDAWAFVESARLRSRELIHKARELAELWLWRARVLRLEQGSQRLVTIAGRTLLEAVAETARELERKGVFVALGNDFPVFGKPYRRMVSCEQERVRSIASERLWGLNWLCGFGADWDDVSLDT